MKFKIQFLSCTSHFQGLSRRVSLVSATSDGADAEMLITAEVVLDGLLWRI